MGFVLALALAAPASALTVAATVSGVPLTSDSDLNGWRFQALDTLIVRELGVWNDGNALPAAVDVGLWRDDGTLLGQATVPAGTAGRQEGGFWFTTLTGLTLDRGTFYRVGAKPQSGRLPFLGFNAPQTFAPEIGYDSGYFGSAFAFPTRRTGQPIGLFGANFSYELAEVPLPAPGLLLLVAVSGVIAARRRKTA